MQTTLTARAEALGNGVTVAFPFTFQFGDVSEIQVWQDGVLKATPTHYTLTPTGGAPDYTGGTVTFLVPPGAPAMAGVPNVITVRHTPRTQLTDLPTSGAVNLDVLERRLDTTVRVVQEQDEALERTMRYDRAAPTTGVVLPTMLTPNRYPKTNADGSGWQFVADGPGSLVNPMSARGQLLRGGVGGAVEAFAPGATGQVPRFNGTDTVFALVDATSLATDAVETAKLKDANVTAPKLAAEAVTSAKLLTAFRAAMHGKCRLTKSGANLLLSPADGNTLVINSQVEQVPDAGVTLAPTGLLANTTYYIYAFMSAGVLTLEASTTAPATQAGTGVRVKTADATRSLVGLVRVGAVAATFTDTAAQRFVLSYFTRRDLQGSTAFAANRTTASATYVELSATERVEFLTWGDEAVAVSVSGEAENNTSATRTRTSVGFDAATAEDAVSGFETAAGGATSNAGYPVGLMLRKSGLAEGVHDARVLGAVSGGTGTWVGSATAGDRTTLHVGLRG